VTEGYPLEDLATVERADVYKRGRLAAHLTRVGDDVEFAYTTEWVAAAGAPVATTLPVTDEPVVTRGGAVPAFFAGQLPEGRRLGALRRSLKTSADDELTLVLAVGGDVVGDVQVVPTDVDPQDVSPLLQVADFADVRFADLLAELEIRVDRVGLPGVQDKVSAAMLNLPVARAGERYVLKLDPPEYPGLVEDEAFFLDAARRTGLEAASAQMVTDADGRPGLLVRRFDRTIVDGELVPLALEDGCQVLDRHPAAKYRLSTEVVLGALSALCGAPRVAARTFLAQLAFAYVTGNGDAHAKNFSVLQGLDGEWRPSPAYDVPSSQPYGDSTLAMSLGGRRDATLPRGAFVSLAAALGVPERSARKALLEIADRADLWVPRLDQLPYDSGTIRKWRRVLDRRRQVLVS
jgi:serine/threonine-protein kinase HipA